MKLGSLFDGSGGFPLAGVLNGITPAWAAEIEPYPIAVTRSRFPWMRHYGNVCDINGAEIEPVDIITAGSPCQDMSVAGLRAGIYEGKRSNLFFESIRIVKEMRAATNGKQPRFFVWENVPGAFSSDKGGAFQAVLQAVCSVKDDTVSIPAPKSNDGTDRLVWLNAGCIVGNGYSVAWRTLDAQFWNVPQRRARIYLVADFDSECAAEILFKPESVRGDMQPGDEAREEVAADALGGTDGSNGCVAWTYRGREGGCNIEYQSEVAYALRNPVGGGSIANVCYEPASLLDENWQKCDVKNALRANASKSSHAIVGCADGGNGAAGVVSKGNGECFLTPERHMSLTVGGGQAGQGYPCVVYPVIALQANGIDRADTAGCNGCGWRESACYTLNTIDRHAVCYTADCRNNVLNEELSGTLQAKPNGGFSLNYINPCVYGIGNGQANQAALDDNVGALNCMHDQQAVLMPSKPPRRYIIRRLMPVECARLQGFPDAHGDLAPYDGDDAFWEQVRKTHAEINGKKYKPVKDIKKWYEKLHNDGAEYKMWGNGIALPCAEYVIRMIKEEV